MHKNSTFLALSQISLIKTNHILGTKSVSGHLSRMVFVISIDDCNVLKIFLKFVVLHTISIIDAIVNPIRNDRPFNLKTNSIIIDMLFTTLRYSTN